MTISKLDTILAAIVVELEDVTNATGLAAASYLDALAMQKGATGGITAYVYADNSEVDLKIEGNQYFLEVQNFTIQLFGRDLPSMKLAVDVIKVLFYKDAPLANIRTAGGNFIKFLGASFPEGTVSSVMEIELSFSLDYETSYTT